MRVFWVEESLTAPEVAEARRPLSTSPAMRYTDTTACDRN